MPRVVFFEMGADDPKRAMRFFEQVFGWKFQEYMDQEYWIAQTGEKKEEGIDGGSHPRRPNTPPIVNTIPVKDIDATIRAIESNGVKIVVPKMEVPGQGTLAYFLDTEGNMHGIMQPLPM
jgi:predicted enzyme related to lactoylglutathione lyase